jgi:hypothetical protein
MEYVHDNDWDNCDYRNTEYFEYDTGYTEYSCMLSGYACLGGGCDDGCPLAFRYEVKRD